ncbi:MAG: ArsI/CadI family heavy metal resistance metalloenzyme [Pseudomonadales bacterium]
MKRFHMNVGVSDLNRSTAFYTTLFGVPPSVVKDDYAKWMLDDPRLNFAISTHVAAGVDHVGVQAENEVEFQALRGRLAEAELELRDQPDVVCCYARSGKAWLHDPDGLAWETFVTRGETTEYAQRLTEATPAAPASPADTRPSCC